MAEKIISPGVFTKEIDASFLPAAVGNIGAVVVGPTVKGPVLLPTVINSYGEFQSIFRDTFKSSSGYYQYLTSHTAKNYLQHSGKMTVCRIMGDGYGGATATVLTGSGNYYTGSATAGDVEGAGNRSFTLNTIGAGEILNNKDQGALYYIVSFPNMVERDKSWDLFINDPDWKKAYEESIKDGPIVSRIEQVFLNPIKHLN